MALDEALPRQEAARLSTMNAKASFSTSTPPRSMLLLRRAADAAGYANAAPADDLPAIGASNGLRDRFDGLRRLCSRARLRLLRGFSRV
jgi:hypothetical protein